MTDSFNEYQQWLGISSEELPAHYYRLLGLPAFETDVVKINNAAEERMAHVHSFQTGRRGHLTHRILNELASARHCLTNPATKVAYDEMLKGQLSVSFDNTSAILPPSTTATAFNNQSPSFPTQNFGGFAPPYSTPSMFGAAAPTGALPGYSPPSSLPPPMAVPISRAPVTPPPLPEPPPIAPQPIFEPASPPILPSIQIARPVPTSSRQKITPAPVRATSPALAKSDEDQVAIYSRPWFPLAAIGTIVLLVAMGFAIRYMLRPRSSPAPVPESDTPDNPDATNASQESAEAIVDKNTAGPGSIVISQEGNGWFNFPASLAVVTGRSAMRQVQNDEYLIANWTDQEDTLSWRFQISRPAIFRVILSYSAPPDAAGGRFALSLGDVEQTGELRASETPGQFLQETAFIAVKRNGEHTLTLRSLHKPGTEFMTFKSLRFVPQNAPREPPEEKPGEYCVTLENDLRQPSTRK